MIIFLTKQTRTGMLIAHPPKNTYTQRENYRIINGLFRSFLKDQVEPFLAAYQQPKRLNNLENACIALGELIFIM